MNRKGFTLAELLAVLSILAIIALIVFPKVGGVIDESEKKAFERSMDGIKRAVEVDYQDDSYRGNRVYKYENGKLTLISVDDVSKNQNIKVEGNMENGMGEIFVDQSGNVFFMFSTDEWCATKSSQFGDISIEEKNDNNCVFNNCPLISIMGKVFRSCELMTNDPDGNLRYVGVNPDNYVWFNNELWRIIGVFDGQAKIIKNDFYSTGMAWDSNNVNDWSQSTLQTELNGTYLNGIEATSKSYIDTTHVWNLGGAPYTTSERTRTKMYSYERGTSVYSGRPTTWTGAIGLMYPSDYGYATSSTDTTCDSTTMYDWDSGTAKTECAQKSWLYNSSTYQWTLTPLSDSSYRVFLVGTTGIVFYHDALYTSGVRPTLFLKENVKITGGSGTSTDPFTLGT